MAILADLRLLLLALWLGAAIFFSAVVAPSAFAVLRAYQLPNASEIAGTIVTRTLSVVNVSGFIVSLILLATAFAFRRANAPRSFVLEMTSLMIVSLGTGVGQWVIAARMQALRVALTLPIDQLPVDDSRRVTFNSLHGYSVKALGIAMIAALFAFVLIAYRTRLNAG